MHAARSICSKIVSSLLPRIAPILEAQVTRIVVPGITALAVAQRAWAEDRREDWRPECFKRHTKIFELFDPNLQNGGTSIKFEQTMKTIHYLRLILDGSPQAYQELIQLGEAKISLQNFRSLHYQAEELLNFYWNGLSRREIAQAMEVALILDNLIKNAKMHEQLLKTHSSFETLPSSAKELLITARSRKTQIPYIISFASFIRACQTTGTVGHQHLHQGAIS